MDTLGIVESSLEKGLYRFGPNGTLLAVYTHNHVDDLFVARLETSARVREVEARMKRLLHLHGRAGEFDSCGIHVQVAPSAVYMDQPKAVHSFKAINADEGSRRHNA